MTVSVPEIMTPRDVPLGGLRAMRVRRTLPQRHRSLIGAWCFADHYGPDEVADTGGMLVPPHPHTGLQTVSWLFTGSVEHRDSAGNHALVLPGELNLMTAGSGVSHSEVSTSATNVLHGVQLWVALPDHARNAPARFDHHKPEPVRGPGWEARVFLGKAFGASSPIATSTPLLGAELMIAPGRTLRIDLDPSFEHGVLLDTGVVTVGEDPAVELKSAELAYLPPGREYVEITAYDEARMLLLGGEPFGEPIVMWWNFVGRTHEEIVGFRDDWQQQIAGSGPEGVVGDSQLVQPGRFGVVVGDHLAPIPAPGLPNARLKQRR